MSPCVRQGYEPDLVDEAVPSVCDASIRVSQGLDLREPTSGEHECGSPAIGVERLDFCAMGWLSGGEGYCREAPRRRKERLYDDIQKAR